MKPYGVCLLAVLLSGCAGVGGTYPRSWSLIPNASLNVADGTAIALNDALAAGIVLGVAYYVIDPLAPNWSIQETRLSPQRVRIALKMKRFHQGGEGEAMSVFRRRAAELAQETGSRSYSIAHWEEGMESNWIPQRQASGEILLVADLAAGSELKE